MRDREPFQREDLDELDALLARATAVVQMREVHAGNTNPLAIGMRHDVDNVLEPAVAFAEWEAERGYRSTYFILHTAPYWSDKEAVAAALDRIAECGHEIGFHVNAITDALQTGREPERIAREALDELRSYGHAVTGVVAHGDQACYDYGFVNDEIFTDSPRPAYGAHDRQIGPVKLSPIPRAFLGLEYDPNWMPRTAYLSDSGGRWSQPFADVAAGFPYPGQLHMLIHPCWWREAFAKVTA